MGETISKAFGAENKKEKIILMLDLDAGGKTAILCKLKMEEGAIELPTSGFRVETIKYKDEEFVFWDISGQTRLNRVLWRHYYANTQGIIFVVDSTDRDRIEEAKEALQGVLNDELLKGIPLLIYANKQDLNEAMNVTEITEKFGLNAIKNRNWYIQGSCAITGDGLHDGLDWLSDKMSKKKYV